MNIGLVDLIIVCMIIVGAIIGFKNGVIKEGTKFIGLLIIIIISFMLKDKLMVFLYENLPFFNFKILSLIKGLSAINILVYQVLSFLIIFIALMFLLKVVVVITGLIELLVKMTVFLSLPTKILGAIVGAVEFYIYVFIILYVLNLPVFSLTYVNNSMLGTKMLENTPILSDLVDDTVSVYSDVWGIIKDKKGKKDEEINTLVLVSLLDHKLITVDSARKLVNSNKIHITDDTILDRYNDEDNLFDELKELYNK